MAISNDRRLAGPSRVGRRGWGRIVLGPSWWWKASSASRGLCGGRKGSNILDRTVKCSLWDCPAGLSLLVLVEGGRRRLSPGGGRT